MKKFIAVFTATFSALLGTAPWAAVCVAGAVQNGSDTGAGMALALSPLLLFAPFFWWVAWKLWSIRNDLD